MHLANKRAWSKVRLWEEGVSPHEAAGATSGPSHGHGCMSAILGISAFYHDSAAALVVDGKLVAAAQEERFTRIKHDFAFPTNAIDYCLAEAKITPEQIDYVGFYDKPLLKF